MKNLKTICAVLLLLISTAIQAALLLGPVSPCGNCEEYSQRTEPVNGVWYNPDQSGSGFSVDIQNGKVFGAHYGYDEQGKQLWLTFVGDLVPSEEPNIMWTLDANLTQFGEGNAFNQSYTSPVITDYQGQIHLKFTQKNHALLSINGGQEHNVVPIVFGVSGTADFSEQTSYLLPGLGGMWNFVFKVNSEVFPSNPDQWGMFSLMLSNRYKSVRLNQDGNTIVSYATAYYGPPPEVQFYGRIECELTDGETIEPTPECVFIYSQGLTQQFGVEDRFYFTLGGLGATRIFGETTDGHTFEAIKMNSTEYQSKQAPQVSNPPSLKFAELEGPQSPCVTCDQLAGKTEPLNALWYNPEQSGIGFGIEIQNGKVFGTYYGYDEQGEQLWLTFVGDLVESNSANIMWTMDADLQQFENGNSFNAVYKSPDTTDYSGAINIQFTHMNHAIFSVNGGAAQNIVPIIFGTSASADFSEYTSYLLPDLRGMWAANYHINWLVPRPYQSFPNQWGYIPNMFEIGEKTINDNEDGYWVNYPVTVYRDFPNTLELGEIRCEVVSNGLGESSPECIFTDNLGILVFAFGFEDNHEFHFPLGGLGAYRIFGETLDGHTFEAVKVDSTEYPKP